MHVAVLGLTESIAQTERTARELITHCLLSRGATVRRLCRYVTVSQDDGADRDEDADCEDEQPPPRRQGFGDDPLLALHMSVRPGDG
jgi:hypothetical protein